MPGTSGIQAMQRSKWSHSPLVLAEESMTAHSANSSTSSASFYLAEDVEGRARETGGRVGARDRVFGCLIEWEQFAEMVVAANGYLGERLKLQILELGQCVNCFGHARTTLVLVHGRFHSMIERFRICDTGNFDAICSVLLVLIFVDLTGPAMLDGRIEKSPSRSKVKVLDLLRNHFGSSEKHVTLCLPTAR